ncbi:MAG TPA: enoyl-CoA hydratase/isomerase family protein [Candidatus Dormibacteraeota bacterium]
MITSERWSPEAREEFMAQRAPQVYARLTQNYTVALRARELVYAAAREWPGLVPGEAEMDAERERLQKDKVGLAIDQGVFLSHILAEPRAGRHLMWAMQRPRADSVAVLEAFQRSGAADLGTARVDRRGNTGLITLQNHAYLNAEDDDSNAAVERAVDLVLMDPQIQVAVLRGGPATHPKHAGRRIFGSGINLTKLYLGKIGLVDFLIERELGLNNKMYRGLAPETFRDDGFEDNVEKPFIAVVESFAIGGACQWLLIMDHVIAESGSYFNLPARKEGIIAGSANLRLPRFVGDRLTRQGIFFNRDYRADSPEGRLLADEVVPAAEIDEAVERATREITSAGITSLVANRRVLRLAQEPLDVHRTYMAWYAREQARCQHSEALIGNLERNWDARSRRLHD